jgi:RND family efflux transporter MFP subunit
MTPRRRRAAGLCVLALIAGGCRADLEQGTSETGTAPANAPLLRVRVAPVTTAPLAGITTVPAVVHPFQHATVAAKIAGRVTQRLVEPGDRVEQGAPLLRIDEADLALAVREAEHTRDVAAAELTEAERQRNRSVTLRRDGVISTSELDAVQTAYDRAHAAQARAVVQLAKAEQARTDATVHAPFTGTVEVVEADVGEYLQPGVIVAGIVDFSKVRLRAGVTATEAAHLEPGTTAQVAFDTLGGALITAELRSVARVADPGSGTYAVELWLSDPDPRLREGMIGELRLRRAPSTDRPVVPRAALLRRGGRTTLFVVEATGDAPLVHERPVRAGRSDTQRVEIVEGVTLGELVVVDGHFALRDGAPVTIDNAEHLARARGAAE